MRTTLDIDDDVLHAAKELARRQDKTAGQVISELSRRALTSTSGDGPKSRARKRASGFRPFEARGGVITNDQINQLRDESGV